MQHLYSISERFSQGLDEVRGTDRRRNYLRQYGSWVQASGARRVVARVLGIGSMGLLAGAAGFIFWRRVVESRTPQLEAVPEEFKLKRAS